MRCSLALTKAKLKHSKGRFEILKVLNFFNQKLVLKT